ncbi:MAG: cysteine hydrolase, partial [Candidatus Hermodarchaeia archaeon]
REKGIPVIFTVYSKTHNYLDRPKTGHLMPGRYSELKIDRSSFFVEGHVWHELAPRDDELVIHKPSYKVVFGSDVTSTDDPDMQEPELKVLRKGFAKVLTADEIIEMLK